MVLNGFQFPAFPFLALARPGLAAGLFAAMLLVPGVGSGGALAFGPTLDETFRGLVREDNAGSLPSYILNRGLVPEPRRKPMTPEEAAQLGRDTTGGVVEMDLGQPLSWLEVVQQVAGGEPSPFAVDAVRRRAESGDGQAAELLAWMHVNGVGVRRDLPRAFGLYVQAADLGVDAARDNAGAIYRAMTVEQRARANNPF